MDAQRTDRIFLHQHDHDQQLAQQFVDKHQLNPSITHHIYERIKFSRDSVAELSNEVTPRRMEGGDHGYSNSNYKLQTPVNHIQSKREPFEEDPSFGNTGS